MQSLGVNGSHRFSSEQAAALVASVAHLQRAHVRAGLNLLMHGEAGGRFVVENSILEGPNAAGGFIDFMANPAFGSKGLPDDLGIGVVRAWDYLQYEAIPNCWLPDPKKCTPWTRPKLAIVDSGFPLDPKTGEAPAWNPDFAPGRPEQFNVQDQTSISAGGSSAWPACDLSNSCPWHGTGVYSVAAAIPRNHFGAAGTSAGIMRPLFIKVRPFSYDVGYAINGAALHGADVINVSLGTSCLEDFCGGIYAHGNSFQTAITSALSWYQTAVIVASAGNDHNEVEDVDDSVPCGLNGVLCVGAIDDKGNRETFSNYGAKIAMWAPDTLPTTPDPDTIRKPVGQQLVELVGGTSKSAPFVSGIICLMKTLNPTLTEAQVLTILQSTALPSADARVTPGYINAFGAVTAVRPNLPPKVVITAPASGSHVFGGALFIPDISDPEQDPFMDGVKVQWSSSIDGILCSNRPQFDCDSLLRTGAHTIRLDVTDPYGLVGSAQIALNVDNAPLSATIDLPMNGDSVHANQTIVLRGSGFSPLQRQFPITLRWTSNLQNIPLGTGTQVWTQLPLGDNVVTLTASNSQGSATASVTVHVLAAADFPSPLIQAPDDGTTVPVGTPITFTGRATDPQFGGLTGAALQWTDDKDGAIGQGQTFVKVLTGGVCAPIVHHITLTATNPAKFKASTSVTVWVGGIC